MFSWENADLSESETWDFSGKKKKLVYENLVERLFSDGGLY